MSKLEPLSGWTAANPHENSYVCEVSDWKGNRIRGQVFHDREEARVWFKEQVKRHEKLKRVGRIIKVVKIQTRTEFSFQV